MTQPVLFITLLGVVCGVPSPALADQIVLTNGDKVTGKIVKKEGDTLTVKADLLGDLNIKWANVASVKSDDALTVMLKDNKTVTGTVEIAEKKVAVTTPKGKEEAPLESLQAVRNEAEQKKYDRLLRPPLWSLWTGYIDLGLADAQGNAKSFSFTSAMKASRVTRHDTTTAYLTEIYSRGLLSGKTSTTADSVRGGWAYNRNLNSRAFVNTFNDYEYDAFQNLDLRVVIGGGLGYKAFKRERLQLGLVGGANYSREQFAVPLTMPYSPNPEMVRTSGEAYWGDDLIYKWMKNSSIRQSYRMFDNLTQTGQYRVNFDIGIDTKLNRWLAWQITASDRFLTNPAPGRKTNDLLLSSGFRITFAR